MMQSQCWETKYPAASRSKLTRYLAYVLAVLLGQWFSVGSWVYADDFTDKCRDILPATFELSDTISSTETGIEARNRILQQASTEAISHTVGALISGRTDYILKSDKDDVDEKLENRMKAQSQGLVRQKVVKERRTKEAGETILTLTIDAEVCVPINPAILKDLVSLTSFVDITKTPNPLFATTVANTFSNSVAYIIADPSDDLVDYQISGQLGEVSIEVVERSRGKSSQSTQLKRAQGMATLVAKQLTGDRGLITHHIDDFRHYRTSMADKAIINDFTKYLIDEVSVGLHDKLLAKRPDASDIPQSAQERAPLPAF